MIDASETFIADGTNLMPATASVLKKKPIHCLAHLGNLVLRDLILSSVNLSVLCGVCSIIVRHFRKSTAAKENLGGSTFILYTKTRFYSFLDMVKSVYENMHVLERYQAPKEKIRHAIDDFVQLKDSAKQTIEIMEPFKLAFTILGSDIKPTSNLALLFYLTIKKTLESMKLTNQLAGPLINILDLRFNKITSDKIFLMANILDPVARRLTNSLPTSAGNRSLMKCSFLVRVLILPRTQDQKLQTS